MTEDKMIGWHHQLHGHEFEQAPGLSDEQGSLACCSPWGRKELDMTEPLHLLLERKAITDLDSILKSRDITLPTKAHIAEAMVSLVMFGCESGPKRRMSTK